MPPRAVSLSAAKAQLSALVNRVAHGGETVVIQSHGRPKAALVPVGSLGAGDQAIRSARISQALREGRRLAAKIARRVRRKGLTWTPIVDELAALRREMAEPRR